jgi:hypothetical protein
MRSEEYRVRWAAHDVKHYRSGVQPFHHPLAGDLTLNYDALEIPADAGQTGRRLHRRTRLAITADTEPARQLGRGARSRVTRHGQLRRVNPGRPHLYTARHQLVGSTPSTSTQPAISKETPVEIQPEQPTTKGPAEWLTGEVWIDGMTRVRNPHASVSARSASLPPRAPRGIPTPSGRPSTSPRD